MNLLAVLLAAIVNMVVGAFWYAPAIFGKRWMQLVNLRPEDIQQRAPQMGRTYGLMFVGSLVTAYVLSLFVGMMQVQGVMAGAAVGFLSWLGFTAPTHGANYLFEGRPASLYGINTGYFLASLVLMGGLLGAFR